MIGASSRSRLGSTSMPTDTKNNTANASRIGSASDAARKLKSDWPTTIPARNAPSAIETPNTSAEPTAMPSASTSTVSVNSSRDLVLATNARSFGTRKRPMAHVMATTAPIRSSALPMPKSRPVAPGCPPLVAMIGKVTSTMTVKMSSTTSQPTATCPAGVWSASLSERTRIRTTVLATEMASPNTRPAPRLQPNARVARTPSAAATRIWTSAPGIATFRTAMSSRA